MSEEATKAVVDATPLTAGEAAGEQRGVMVRAAARLLVFDTSNEHEPRCVLVRHPRKGIEPPGGAVDPGESALDAALREFEEETGWRLPAGCRPSFLGTMPCVDPRGGHWLDVLYVQQLDQPLEATGSEPELTVLRYSRNELIACDKVRFRSAILGVFESIAARNNEGASESIGQ